MFKSVKNRIDYLWMYIKFKIFKIKPKQIFPKEIYLPEGWVIEETKLNWNRIDKEDDYK